MPIIGWEGRGLAGRLHRRYPTPIVAMCGIDATLCRRRGSLGKGMTMMPLLVSDSATGADCRAIRAVHP